MLQNMRCYLDNHSVAGFERNPNLLMVVVCDDIRIHLQFSQKGHKLMENLPDNLFKSFKRIFHNFHKFQNFKNIVFSYHLSYFFR